MRANRVIGALSCLAALTMLAYHALCFLRDAWCGYSGPFYPETRAGTDPWWYVTFPGCSTCEGFVATIVLGLGGFLLIAGSFKAGRTVHIAFAIWKFLSRAIIILLTVMAINYVGFNPASRKRLLWELLWVSCLSLLYPTFIILWFMGTRFGRKPEIHGFPVVVKEETTEEESNKGP